MTTYIDCLVHGRLRPVTGSRCVGLIDPATELPSSFVRLCSSADVDAALKSSHRLASDWAVSSVADRQQVLRRIRAALDVRQEGFVQAMAADIGCPVWLSRNLHVPMALKDLDIAAVALTEVRWTEVIGNAVVERVPHGVVAAITPWNAPLHQMVAKVAAAIAAGCTTVLKPSELAPGCASLFIDALVEADLPPGLVNVVWGDAEIGAKLVTDPRVDKVSFTGSSVTGRQILARCAESMTPASLELGGKSAALLLDDADLDVALPMVLRSCMGNSGQTCVAQSRLIIPEHRCAEVLERVPALLDDWPLGAPLDESTRLGPLATRAQFERVQGHIRAALDSGARLLCGGAERARSSGYYLAPTVLTEVHPDMPVASTEVFGPVLCVQTAVDDDDAVRQANATPYGLSGAVWSTDPIRSARVARRLRTGQVVLNGAAQNLATPFGGWGASGLGRENGRFGIEEFLQYRSLHGLAERDMAALS